jgi:hypothetical protein
VAALRAQLRDALQARDAAAAAVREEERGLRAALQRQVREREEQLDGLRRLREKEQEEQQARQLQRAQELAGLSAKDLRGLAEQKNFLEDELRRALADLSRERRAQAERAAQAQEEAERLAALVEAVAVEAQGRSLAETARRALQARLDEAEAALADAEEEKERLEGRLVEQERELLAEAQAQTQLREEFAAQLAQFCESLDAMYDARAQLQDEKEALQGALDELEQKLLDEASLRVDLDRRLQQEAQLRQELEDNFVEKLEKLSLLIMAEREGSTYDEDDPPPKKP